MSGHVLAQRHRLFVRDFAAWGNIEAFLVSAVAAVLGIRFLLAATGYPQIGGAGLHIAHMLWGGLLMLVALVVVLSFLTETAERLAAILGGFGFGTFIDEVGKFVTSDNDYFFRPAVAIIYSVFVALFVVLRRIHAPRSYTRTEYLMNALESLEDLVFHSLDEEERRRALGYLRESDPDHPLVAALERVLAGAILVPIERPGALTRLRRALRERYTRLACQRGFPVAIVVFFVAQMGVKIFVALLFVLSHGQRAHIVVGYGYVGRIAGTMPALGFADWAEIASTFAAGAFVLRGAGLIRRDRIAAFGQFRRSVLIAIFLSQVFLFYRDPLVALVGLTLNILLLLGIDYVIARERTGIRGEDCGPDVEP